MATSAGSLVAAGAPVPLVGEANHRHAHVSEADVAAFAVAAVEKPLAENARIAIGGPSCLWRKVVEANDTVDEQEPRSLRCAPPAACAAHRALRRGFGSRALPPGGRPLHAPAHPGGRARPGPLQPGWHPLGPPCKVRLSRHIW
jgi:uncharacterized protein YbjT (DUF2867 family)